MFFSGNLVICVSFDRFSILVIDCCFLFICMPDFVNFVMLRARCFCSQIDILDLHVGMQLYRLETLWSFGTYFWVLLLHVLRQDTGSV